MVFKKKLSTAGLMVMVIFAGLSFGFTDRINPYESGVGRIFVSGAIPALGVIIGALVATIFGLTETVHDESEK